jgi:histidinol dehydrogenase
MCRLDWPQLGEGARRAALTRPAKTVAPETRSAVAAILDEVRTNGDAAVHEFSRRFDNVALTDFQVTAAEFAAGSAQVPATVRTAIADAARRIETYHRAGMARPYAVDTDDGVRCERILRAIARVGLYVPAGSAPLPSTA